MICQICSVGTLVLYNKGHLMPAKHPVVWLCFCSLSLPTKKANTYYLPSKQYLLFVYLEKYKLIIHWLPSHAPGKSKFKFFNSAMWKYAFKKYLVLIFVYSPISEILDLCMQLLGACVQPALGAALGLNRTCHNSNSIYHSFIFRINNDLPCRDLNWGPPR